MPQKDTQTKLKHWQPYPDITQEQLEEMRVDVVERIVVARVGLLLRPPGLVTWQHVYVLLPRRLVNDCPRRW